MPRCARSQEHVPGLCNVQWRTREASGDLQNSRGGEASAWACDLVAPRSGLTWTRPARLRAQLCLSLRQEWHAPRRDLSGGMV